MKTFTLNSLALLAALASTGALAQGVLPQSASPRPLVAPTLPPGLYVSVTDGQIVLANKGGTTNFAAGQFGYTASPTQPPVLVPKNPAILFTPPPTFSSSAAGNGAASGNKPSAVDCVVR
ncbi:hypothetical protein [Polaromonas sp. YR568]|uniref:hypothetical protein n=1 Tax=Polaromonas sp. YR568 TaxID=1855301 RepID=UPI00398C0463